MNVGYFVLQRVFWFWEIWFVLLMWVKGIFHHGKVHYTKNIEVHTDEGESLISVHKDTYMQTKQQTYPLYKNDRPFL